MSKMIQIRNVPDPLHRKLKARAAMEGISLSEYLLRELRALAERPTYQELVERIGKRARAEPSISPADAVREERDRR